MASSAELRRALRRFGLEDDRLDSMAARRIGAPPVEFKAMDHITEAGELTPSQLADRLALSSGAVTAVIDRLERLGWVSREPHASDRRSVVVRKTSTPPTSEAQAIYEPYAAAVARAANRLSPAERAAVVSFLEEAAAAARAQADRLKD